MPKESMYAGAWKRLKETKSCTLIADVKFHARIVKAMSKRKDEDKAYKFLCTELDKKEQIEVSYKGNEIHFKLKRIKLGIGDL